MQFIYRLLLLFSVFLILISCSRSDEKIPASVLNANEMVLILIDLQLADAAVNLSNYGQSSFPTDKEKLFETIYDKHKITKKKFEESFAYYTAHPEKFEKIYDQVITGLSSKQAESSK